MSYEILVGLNVSDDVGYAKYRELMTPLLRTYGGDFRYDFKIAEVLKTESDTKMNRVFIIRFPEQSAKEKFFADPEYLKVRLKFFDQSVSDRTAIAEYNR